MTAAATRRQPDRPRDGLRLASALAVLCLGGGVLLGWMFHIPVLVSVLPGLTTMKANTGLGLALAAAAILSLRSRAAVPRGAAMALGSVVMCLGLLTLAEYGAHVRLGLDELLFADPHTTSPPYPGRMSPATAASLVAVGASLVLLARARGRRLVVVAHLLAAIPAACGCIALVGYAYGVEHLQRLGPFVAVALNSAVALVLLALALVLTRREEGWSRRFAEAPIARAALLRIGGASVALCFLAGLLVVQGERAGLYDPRFSPTLFTMIGAAVLSWLALHSASVLARAEAELRSARAEALGQGQELAETRGLHDALVDGLPQLVWGSLPDGHCNYLSRQWVEYTGIAEAEQLGFGWLQAIDARDIERTRQHWLGAVAGRHPYDLEYRIRGADGVSRWFKARGVPLRDAAGRIKAWFGTSTDIEEIVAARELLARSREELERQVAERTSELMEVEEKLRQSQKMEAVGQLTGGIAHDFNNILMVIKGNLERLQVRLGQARYEAASRYVDNAQAAADRAAALTHRLLAFSRRQTLEPRPTDVGTLVTGMKELIGRTVGPAIALDVVLPADLWTVLVDPPQLESALLNLAINARDAMAGGGRIVIEVAHRRFDAPTASEFGLPIGDYVSICLTDTGCGMPPEIVARAFDPFFTTKPLGSGTGLGLSMVYGFVRQSGGLARIVSAPGRGTTVCLYLPRHTLPVGASPPPATGARPRRAASACVLVVDDEATIRMLVAEALGELGCTTIEAADGPAALEVLRTAGRIDLLVTDVGLPGPTSGREVAAAARAARPGLPVLFITGYSEGAVLDDDQQVSGTHVMTKPFSMEALSAKVADLLADPKRNPPPRIAAEKEPALL